MNARISPTGNHSQNHQGKNKKKKSNAERSLAKLDEYGISYQTKNYTHYIITYNGKTLDYYPSTGLWWDRANKKQHRGIRQLLNHLEIKRIDNTEI